MQNLSVSPSQATAIKVAASTSVLAGVGLWLWQLFNQLPTVLDNPFWQRVIAIANAALVIHLIEGIIAAIVTFKVTSSLRVKKTLQAGVYVFFVGTIGLQETVKANNTNADAEAT